MKLTSYFQKQELNYLPWDELLDLRQSLGHQGTTDWLKRYQIAARHWVLPQLYQHIANFKKTPDCADYARLNTKSTLDRGVFVLATHPQRGELVSGQIRTPRYGALVPLLLAPHKEQSKTPYSYWQNKQVALDPKLQEVLHDCEKYQACVDLGSDTLLQLLDLGLVYKSGKNMGKKRVAQTTWRIYHAADAPDCVKSLSVLSQAMLFQIWLAHPQYRLPTMVLDPRDWDSLPEPLVGSWNEYQRESKQPAVEKPTPVTDLPWEW